MVSTHRRRTPVQTRTVRSPKIGLCSVQTFP